MVIGDSTAVALFDALALWGELNEVQIDLWGFGGCSPVSAEWDLLVDHPETPFIPANDICQHPWEQIAETEIVVVSYQGVMTMEHRRDGGDWTSIADGDDLRQAMEADLTLISEMTSGRVLFLSIPMPTPDNPGSPSTQCSQPTTSSVKSPLTTTTRPLSTRRE